MSSISHQEYKDLMTELQRATVKGNLKEALDPVGHEDSDIDNDGDSDKTDKYLHKRRQAINKSMKEGDIDEYSYTDNYPGSWGYREGYSNPGEESQDRLESIVHSLKDNYAMSREDAYDYLIIKQGVDNMLAQSVVDSVFGTEEGLNPDPLQATGPTLSENMNKGYSNLTPDERKQLKEYIESVKTIKQEIAKLVSKAGKKVKEEKIGGNRTGLTMPVGNYE